MTFTSIHFYQKKISSKESRLNPSNSWRAGVDMGEQGPGPEPGFFKILARSPARIPDFAAGLAGIQPGPAPIPGGTIVSMGFLVPAGTHKNFKILGIEKISEFRYRPLLAKPILRRFKKSNFCLIFTN